MQHLSGGELNSENSDVVFLAEGLGGAGDRFGRLGADGAGAVEAEEFAGWRLGFYNAVREEG